jgi:hypothetical protein
MFSFTDVDTNDVAVIDQYGIGFLFLLHDDYDCWDSNTVVSSLSENSEGKKWFEYVTSIVIQSVPSQRTTNRLIRGNRTNVQKRCGSYSCKQDRNQGRQRGFPHREKMLRSGNGLEDTCKYRLEISVDFWLHRWDRQELIRAVGIADIPRSKRKEAFSDEFISCLAKIMVSKCRHGSLHNVESPTGESMLVCGKREEQVECEFFGFKVFEPFFGSQSMVEPRKGVWNLSHEVRNDRYEGFLQRHDRFSKGLLLMRDVHYILRCTENRLDGEDWAQKLEKLASFQLSKLSDLGNSFPQLEYSKKFTKIAETEIGRTDNWKKIQQINKFRFEGDSKSPSFVTHY